MQHLCDLRIRRITLSAVLTGFLFFFNLPAQAQELVHVQGELKQWHRVSIHVECPESACGSVSEISEPNPFTYYRLLVTFTSPDEQEVFRVPGYYAGDGMAAYTEATAGNIWIAHFSPHAFGTWKYEVSFQEGEDLVLVSEPGIPIGPDGFNGTFEVAPTDKTGKDFRAKGFLRHINKHYYYFSGTDTPFLKNGTGSPENILFYHEIANTYKFNENRPNPPHQFEPHLAHFNAGDPLFGPDKSKGKGIIGALNYISSLDINSYYFVTNNTALDAEGQGTGVWPWISPNEASRDRFSVAKLAQWEVIFSHMDSLGISMNMVTQDRINQWDLDGGELGRIRKLYYRELIARFGHHLGMVWNLGEENSATTDQVKDYANFFRQWDVYQHPIVSQSNGTLDAHERYYTPLLGFDNFHGVSLQVGLTPLTSPETPSPPGKIHDVVLRWINESNEAGTPWVITLDEIGHYSDGIVPDGDPRDPTNRRARREGFWGTLMAGGAGADWYYGSDPHEYNDIFMEDFSMREAFFQRTQAGIRMIEETGLPYWEMENLNEISSDSVTWVFGKEDEAYFVYSPYQDPFLLNLPEGEYIIYWFDAFAGGPLQEGTIKDLEVSTDSSWVSIGQPIGFEEDAVAVVAVKPEDNSNPDNTSTEGDTPGKGRLATLKQNYPNPVHSRTSIAFELHETQRVELKLFDTLGREVQLIEHNVLPGGTHRYELDLSNLPAGLYLYRLRIGDAEALSKLLIRL